MRRVLSVLLMFSLLTGCKSMKGTDPALVLREKLLTANGCSFRTVITADYGDHYYVFTLDCTADSSGDISFTVVSPETISGITGTIDQAGGNLTFEDQILAFPLVADDQLSPISAPWLLVRTLRSGYISSGGQDGEYYKLQMDDSYEEDPLRADIWLDDGNIPTHCDFMWDNKRILSVEIANFAFL